MSKKQMETPDIWLQDGESFERADCGCQIARWTSGTAFYFCPLHRAAPELLAALKAMHLHFITEAISGIGAEEEKLETMSMTAIAKAEEQNLSEWTEV